jgi:phosphonate transport system substrate-binding protein
MQLFQIASCMAQNAAFTCRAIAEYVSHKIDLPTRFVENVPWQDCEALLDQGKVHLCWICGLPYAWKATTENPHVELCAVPIMREERYQKRPVYFSDVVVHRQSAFQSFTDLRGASWAYNEPRSHSGYNVVRHHLAKLGERGGYFGRVIESGTHQLSLEMIVSGEIDASAIDSTVLDAEVRRSPRLKEEIRVVETLGPSPMPPWVILKSLARELKDAVTAVLLDMHAEPSGNRILESWGISHFARPDHGAYEAMLRMGRDAEGVRLGRD